MLLILSNPPYHAGFPGLQNYQLLTILQGDWSCRSIGNNTATYRGLMQVGNCESVGGVPLLFAKRPEVAPFLKDSALGEAK
jgi:hypothetical protein